MDPVIASIIVEAIKIVAPIVTAVLAFLTVMQSRRNSVKLDKTDAKIDEVHVQTNSIVTGRIEAEQRVASANAEVARHEGGDAARIIGEERADALRGASATVPVAIVEAIPLKIEKDTPTAVNVVEAIPIEIKKT